MLIVRILDLCGEGNVFLLSRHIVMDGLSSVSDAGCDTSSIVGGIRNAFLFHKRKEMLILIN